MMNFDFVNYTVKLNKF